MQVLTQANEKYIGDALLQKTYTVDFLTKKRVYSSKYALSSLVFCSKCGDIYRRIAWNNRGKYSIIWRCCTRVEHGPGACDAETIPEDELQMVTVKAFNQLY